MGKSQWLKVLLLAGLSLGCNPYSAWEGEFNAGPVDPINFAPEYLGEGGDRFRTGAGRFNAASAFVAGTSAHYFSFPFSAGQAAAADPLRVVSNGKPVATVPAPLTYVFDPTEESPFPTEARCQVEEGYSYDPVRDDVRRDEQGLIFTALPEVKYTPGVEAKTTYVPVARQVAVTSNGVPCQEPKSEENLVNRTDVTLEKIQLPTKKFQGVPDGRYVALAVIDPGAGVYRYEIDPDSGKPLVDEETGEDKVTPTTGVGLQRWGWFNHYLLAYLEGGYIPTAEGTATVASQPVPVTRLVAQKLYVPRSPVGADASADPGEVGAGYDVLQFKRGEPGYSPICEVVTYDLGAPTAPEALPRSATDIEAAYSATFEAGDPKYFYCLQLQ